MTMRPLLAYTRARLLSTGDKIASDYWLPQSQATSILESKTTTALARYMAALSHLDGEYLDTWEPETLRHALRGISPDIPEEVVVDLLAIQTLRRTPDFYEDALVFEKVVAALNEEVVDFETWQEPAPGHIAWAVEQARQVTHGLDPDDDDTEEQAAYFARFDREPREYTAAVCFRAGMVFLPDDLSFAQEELTDMTPQAAKLREQVSARWGEIKNSNLTEIMFAENELDVQLALCAAVTQFRRDQERETMRLLGVSTKGPVPDKVQAPRNAAAILGSKLK